MEFYYKRTDVDEPLRPLGEVKKVNLIASVESEPAYRLDDFPSSVTIGVTMSGKERRKLRKIFRVRFRVPRKLKKAIKRQNPHIDLKPLQIWYVAYCWKHKYDKNIIEL